MQLIVGLGNPGTKYTQTRHNIGFLVVDALADGAVWTEKKSFKGEVAEVKIDGKKVLLLKPMTFMNLSGESVRAVADFYKIPLEQIIVVHDDLDLPFGEVKIKSGQSSAGHNGVQSIMDCFGGAKTFTRVRIGIGRPSKETGTEMIAVEDWVLSKWSAEEKKQLKELVGSVAELVSTRLNTFFIQPLS